MSALSCRGKFDITTVFLVIAALLLVYLIYSESEPGEYSQWSNWSLCSKSCGEGSHVRVRRCDSPKAGLFGKECQGTPYMRKKCHNKEHCPVDGGLSEWSAFGKCKKDCGGGVKERTRSCTNPMPAYGGKPCNGEVIEKIDCNVQPCPVDGGFSVWGEFSKCEITGNKPCGGGKKIRTRTCNNPVPQYGGKTCEGAQSENKDCEIACPTTTIPMNTTNSTYLNQPTATPTTIKNT